MQSNRKKIIVTYLSAVLVLAAVVIFEVGRDSFLKKSADTAGGENITYFGSASYQDSEGATVRSNSRINTIKKVSLFSVVPSLSGRTSNPSDFSMSFINPTTLAQIGSLTAGMDQSGQLTPDWTSIDDINVNQAYDLRISYPGFLSRRVSVLLPNQQTITSQLRAGDVNQDGRINWEDYVLWKIDYNKNGPELTTDFNGDGKVNFYDYALSFGTKCYNATETNQDTWCNQ